MQTARNSDPVLISLSYGLASCTRIIKWKVKNVLELCFASSPKLCAPFSTAECVLVIVKCPKVFRKCGIAIGYSSCWYW